MPSSKRSAPILTRFKKFGSQFNFKKRYSKTVVFAQKKPFTSFFVALGVLLLVIVLGSTIFKAKTPKVETRSLPKNVSVYSMGAAPRISVQGEVKKSGVIKIVAQTPGIVSSIDFSEGDSVSQGQVLVSLSSNYQGGNAASVQREIAYNTNKNAKDTYDIQKDLIKRQRELADKSDANADQLRDITSKSIDETKSLLSLNQDIVSSLNTSLSTLQSTNVGGANDAQILQTKQLISQFQSAVNQLQSGVRASEYQGAGDKPPADLSNMSKDLTQKQLDLQEKALALSLEISGLQLKMAQIQESTMYPAAPFGATVQKIHVKVGDSVNPGTPLVTISGDAGDVIVDAKVTKEIADKVSQVEKAIIFVDGKKIEIVPCYVSTEATSGQLYSVLFTVDEEFKKLFTDSSFVTVSIPVGQSTGTTIPFIPIDSVFQTQDEAFVFVVQTNKAQSKKVKLGAVTGGYVTVEQGLSSTDQVILDRTVIDGDAVTVAN